MRALEETIEMKTGKWTQYVLGLVAMLAIVLGGQAPAVAASTSLQTGTWLGEYYSNTDLIGGPVLTRQDAAIDFNWGSGAPAAGIPADGFSVRWTRTVSLDAGLYRFRATVDDGIRVFLDSVLIIDSWRDGGQRELTADRQVTAGSHTLRVEYYERSGLAVARLRWDKVGTTITYPDWRGEYWNNVSLSGTPALVRADKTIDFEWGSGAPATGIAADNFSARWTRTATFTEGSYLFRATVDDGIRVYVDGSLVIDDWRDGGRRQLTAERRMTAGSHTLRVEYYERGGVALAHLSWEDVTPTTTGWKGEYWNNINLSGNPALVRTDSVLAFDWGQKSPSSVISTDNFSARWTRRAYFDGGTYRFHILVDDGIRLWVDDELILDAWSDHDSAQMTVNDVLTQGTHSLKIEYYERIGNARVWVWWEKATVSVFPDWKGEYWNNATLSGDPVLTRNDRDVNFDWGQGSPSPSLPVDNFSARWTRKVPLENSLYRFHILADDGIRLWIDGQLRYDAWRDQQASDMTVDLSMSKGAHEIRIEYYEHGGDARVHVWWEQISSPTYPDWRGEYWKNRDLSGTPALVRNDPSINFNWGTDAPAVGLPSDNFSARWVRQVTFTSGLYRFYAVADDGVRVYLNDAAIINEWHDNDAHQVYTADVSVSGTRTVVIEYFEHGGGALVHVWWSRIGN
jgi:hypothetical protein